MPHSYNFDGHLDYRVSIVEDGKADLYDVFIFDRETKSFVKDAALSGTINPLPDPENKQVRCIRPGGPSGAIFTGTVYEWDGKKFQLANSVRQTDLVVDGKIVCVRAKATLENGVRVIRSIERIKPHWED